MKPWREIAIPHADVLKGIFQQVEFAADITADRIGKAPAIFLGLPLDFSFLPSAATAWFITHFFTRKIPNCTLSTGGSTTVSDDVTTVELRENLSDAINKAAFGKKRVVVTRRGKKLAGIVPYEDIELLEALEDKKDIEKGTISMAQLKKELGM